MIKNRKEWENWENEKLIELWHLTGSINLISILMNRTVPSVQTQASRITLPQRNENGLKHRRKWTVEDEDKLFLFLEDVKEKDNKFDIQKLANDLDRSIDAIITKMFTKYPKSDSIYAKILLKPVDNIHDELNNKKKKRKCLRCGSFFWSEGIKNRICSTCTKLNNEEVDWSF